MTVRWEKNVMVGAFINSFVLFYVLDDFNYYLEVYVAVYGL